MDLNKSSDLKLDRKYFESFGLDKIILDPKLDFELLIKYLNFQIKNEQDDSLWIFNELLFRFFIQNKRSQY